MHAHVFVTSVAPYVCPTLWTVGCAQSRLGLLVQRCAVDHTHDVMVYVHIYAQRLHFLTKKRAELEQNFAQIKMCIKTTLNALTATQDGLRLCIQLFGNSTVHVISAGTSKLAAHRLWS